MAGTVIFRIYKARLRLAAVASILEVASIVSPLADFDSLSRMKLARQAPLRSLIFALCARCARFLDDACYNLELSGGAKRKGAFDPRAALETLQGKKARVAESQRLLEKGETAAAIKMLAGTKDGLEELAGRMDAALERKIR